MSLTKIGSIGINTGIAFAGVTTIVTLNTANDALSIGATVNVGSGITLGASGDIFATGVSTFSGNLKVGSGVTISPDGDGFYTGVVTATTFSGALAASSLTGALPAISGANLTNLDASDLASGTVPTARLGSGTASSSTFLRGDSSFQTVNTDLVSDTSPQLGGDLASNGNDVVFADSDKAIFGTGSDLQIYHTPDNSWIKELGPGSLNINTNRLNVANAADNAVMINAVESGAVELYHNGIKRFETDTAGVRVVAPEGVRAELRLLGDEGDDNNDYFKLSSGDGTLKLQDASNGSSWEDNIVINAAGSVDLYHDNTKVFETSAAGIKLNGADSNGAQFQLGASNDLAIEHDGTNSYIYNNTNSLLIQCDAAVEITAKSGGTKRFRFDSDGLKFGTDTATANALDDYEEGNWTPGFEIGGSASGISYSDQSAYYTKIGRIVHCSALVGLTNKGSNSGNVFVTGLPFMPINAGGARASGSVGYYNNSSGVDLPILILIEGNQQKFQVRQSQSGSAGNFDNSNLTNTFGMFFSLSYVTAS